MTVELLWLCVAFITLSLQEKRSYLTTGMQGGEYGELGGSLPAIASLNASYSTSLSIPSPYMLLPPAKLKAISDVRRTFCLFVTFDFLFVSLLWIIELNIHVSLEACLPPLFCRAGII